MEEFIQQLKLPFELEKVSDTNYSAQLGNSDEWDKVYLILENRDFLMFDEDNSTLNLFESHLHWTDDTNQYSISLVADFEHDKYELGVRKKK